MSGAPARGTLPRRQRRHNQKHEKQRKEQEPSDEPEEKRPKVNPIFLWASQREQRIIEVRCEDYDKRNRIKLTKTPQGWRSIPRTASNVYSTGLALLSQEKKLPSSAASTAVSDSCERKESGKEIEQSSRHATSNLLQRGSKEPTANGRTSGLDGRKANERKRSYDEVGRKADRRRDYAFSLDGQRGRTKAGKKWKKERRRLPCSDEDDEEEEEDEEENEEVPEQKRFGKVPTTAHEGSIGRTNLERLQKDKLFQPRVVLEQLRFSQLPEARNLLQRSTRNDQTAEKQREDGDAIDQEKPVAVNEKRRRTNKAGIQDILNMIDATASPVLAADTPSADLPVDSTKTYDVLSDSLHRNKPVEDKIKDSNSALLIELASKVQDQPTTNSPTSRGNRRAMRDDDDVIDEKLQAHDEQISNNCTAKIDERKTKVNDDIVLVSFKSSSESGAKSCKIAEADGGVGSRTKARPSLLPKWQKSAVVSNTSADVEEERPDEPGEPASMDYTDSSKILNALRNTPGLSVSITRTHTPESTKNVTLPPSRPSSKGSSSSRSPDSQAECVERLFKQSLVDSASTTATFVENRGSTESPRNLPGLSIIIPSYRYRHPVNHIATTHSASPSTKTHRVESPESTVNFPRPETYTDGEKLDGFPHEEDDVERDIEEEDEDDCDSQVLEDLRRQNADSLAYEAVDTDYYRRTIINSQEDRKTPQENGKNLDNTTPHWISSSKSSEAQAKCKYQDLEHFDEQVLEELRSRGTVVSPQPSGIPCSPASRRPSSAYLERLLPSPPCSVTCSEDAKNDLTLKGILASPNRLEIRDCERSKDAPVIRSEPTINNSDQYTARADYTKEVEKSTSTTRKSIRNVQERLTIQNQEIRNSGRPMSSGDIHSTFFPTDRATPKRPMSAEWLIDRQKKQSSHHGKSANKLRSQGADQQCATSSTTDKLLDPASQLRELIESLGHLIPDPLLVPRDYLPALAAAPGTEIPKLLTSRPELRLPEALNRPDLLRDPDLLVISLAHLQHVLDHGEGPVSRSRYSQPRLNNGTNKGSPGHASTGPRNGSQSRPKLTCKPIGTLMPGPIDLSSSRRASPYPPLLRVRSGLLKQEPEVSSTANSPDDSQLWHPLFGSQKRQQTRQQPNNHHQQASWHRTTLAS